MTTIRITGAGGTFCFEAEIIKQALRAEGIVVNVITNYEYELTDEEMDEVRRRMKGDWSGGTDGPKDEFNLGKIEREVLIIEDHQPWGG